MKPAWFLVIPIALALAGGVGRAAMHGGGGHHAGGFGGRHGGFGGHGFHGHGPHVFIDGGFFFGAPFFWDYDPFFYGDPYYYYPYPPAYAYPYPPPPPEEAEAAPEEPEASSEASPASYGLVSLRGVPDGASVDLDGRFWLTAEDLAARWLALPEGSHTITVRQGDAEPKTRRLEVRSGTTHILEFGG